MLDEWLAAISKLYDALEGWIREADSGLGILGISRDKTVQLVSEPRLGHYNVHLMWVTFGGAIGAREALVVPKARYVASVIQPPGRAPRQADGLVEIRSSPMNLSSMPEYYLFRWKAETGDEWFIRSVSDWNANPDDNRVDPLSREQFEIAMLRVLQ
ncbi:MAG TPA: hypothetical protein VLM40_18800 [Gemmata sp.]|nr:hypothetical protein [Gemmata sp.]